MYLFDSCNSFQLILFLFSLISFVNAFPAFEFDDLHAHLVKRAEASQTLQAPNAMNTGKNCQKKGPGWCTISADFYTNAFPQTDPVANAGVTAFNNAWQVYDHNCVKSGKLQSIDGTKPGRSISAPVLDVTFDVVSYISAVPSTTDTGYGFAFNYGAKYDTKADSQALINVNLKEPTHQRQDFFLMSTHCQGSNGEVGICFMVQFVCKQKDVKTSSMPKVTASIWNPLYGYIPDPKFSGTRPSAPPPSITASSPGIVNSLGTGTGSFATGTASGGGDVQRRNAGGRRLHRDNAPKDHKRTTTAEPVDTATDAPSEPTPA
ncbi:MAG: hypothetical protein Q9227_009358 [Pyrenula ochraceoflavens]